jgi:predicted metal-dependent HD superfamily phosphohydrolase
MTTRHNAIPEGSDAQVLVDIDLSILGASPERFDEYERQVREEYAWVPDDVFRHVRKGILEEFLTRPSIFNTRFFRDRLEQQARTNLARSIRALAA